MWTHGLAVACGGAVGALARWLVGMYLPSKGFPWATLFVNVSGSLAFGMLMAALAVRELMPDELRVFVFAGLLGAFTTFSTFSWDTFALFQQGEPLRALLNIAANFALCLAAVAGGYTLINTLK
ncbi:MAG TPA: fluoride efflux transporter CrcB [Gammaproteobacteria bacterium]|nr:fluoride efflux transporter CrcB [Gammaproteobacteria bacterium]